MDYKRSDRVGDQIRMQIAEIILAKVKDPRVGFVTVTSVKLSDDLRHARVYIGVMGEDPAAAFEGLEKARGFIRGELGRRVKLRFVPELSFYEDHRAEEAARIAKLIDDVNEPSL